MAINKLRRRAWNAETQEYDINHYETDPDVIKGWGRQPSTAYAVGDIAYSASLPAGYYLVCTTAGTTGSGELSTGGYNLTPQLLTAQ